MCYFLHVNNTALHKHGYKYQKMSLFELTFLSCMLQDDSPITSWFPSAEYLTAVLQDHREQPLHPAMPTAPGSSAPSLHPLFRPGSSLLEYEENHMANLTGRVLKADHNFKLTKSITDASHERMYCGMLNFMNEYGQIIAKFFTSTTSFQEVENGIQALNDRYAALQVGLW